MKVQVIKGFACRDIHGRMIYPIIGDVIELPDADAQRLAERGSVVILEEAPAVKVEPKPAKKKVL